MVKFSDLCELPMFKLASESLVKLLFLMVALGMLIHSLEDLFLASTITSHSLTSPFFNRYAC